MKAQAGPSFAWIDPSQRSVELARRVVQTMDTFTRSPETLYETKLAILRELMDLDRSPRLLVQTNPPEGSTVDVGPGFIEIFGLTEPGTAITVNGSPVPVDATGYFGTALHLTVDRNVALVTARNAAGHKIARRTFSVVH